MGIKIGRIGRNTVIIKGNLKEANMQNVLRVKNAVCIMLISLVALVTIPLVIAGEMPASKTEEQQLLEEKAAQEATVTEVKEPASKRQSVIDMLPEDNTPRYQISSVDLQGNTLLDSATFLNRIPSVYNSSKQGIIDTQFLYDLRPFQLLMDEPGTSQKISARSIKGFTEYVLSIYQKHHYAGIYVSVPADAFDEGGAISQGTLPVVILEIPVSSVSSSYYDANNQPQEETFLKVSAIEGWSPVKEGRVANRKKLDDYLNLLNLNPDRYAAAVVSKGSEPDTLAVKYNVYEANPWHYFIQVDNSGTEDIQWRPRFGLINTNLTGHDDRLTAVYQTTPDSTWDQGYAVFGSYDVPVAGPKLRMTLYAGYSQFNIPDPSTISFFGNGSFVGSILRYNAMQFDDWFWDITGSISYEESRITTDLTELFPGVFSTSNIHMTLWGLGTELNQTTDMTDTFFAFNAYGLLDSSSAADITATRTGNGASDDFHIYQLSGRHSRYLDTDKVQRLSASARVIIADDRLVPSKMTTFGGMYTVRGYQESDTVGDGGIISSIQYEYDLIRSGQIEMYGQDIDENERKPFLKKLAPLVFLDYGQAWIEDISGTEYKNAELASVGCGIIAELGDNFTGTVYYGYPLIDTDDTDSGNGRVHAGLLLRW